MRIALEPRWRNPFKVTKETLLMKLYKRRFENKSSVAQEALAKRSAPQRVVQKLFRFIWRNYFLSSKGQYAFTNSNFRSGGAITRVVSFDVRNTQYHALYLERYRYGYEPEVTNFLDLVLDDESVFYDIGANWGYFSLFVASKPGFRGRVYAFEPLPQAFKDLEMTVKNAGVDKVVRCYNTALSDWSGKGLMVLPDRLHSGLAKLERYRSGQKTPSDSRLTDVTGLEQFIEEHQLPPPSVMKIDAEGSEWAILRGAENVIRESLPVIIFENWGNVSKPEESIGPLQLLEELGYLCFIPCWLVGDGWDCNEEMLLADNRALSLKRENNERVRLALKWVHHTERLIYLSKINCVAVHGTRKLLRQDRHPP